MKSRNRIITINKARDIGIFPSYINLAHRHLEKGNPIGELEKGVVYFSVPVDLLSVGGLIPSEIIEGIESLELVYVRR